MYVTFGIIGQATAWPIFYAIITKINLLKKGEGSFAS